MADPTIKLVVRRTVPDGPFVLYTERGELLAGQTCVTIISEPERFPRLEVEFAAIPEFMRLEVDDDGSVLGRRDA